jgi:hypothetical protein
MDTASWPSVSRSSGRHGRSDAVNAVWWERVKTDDAVRDWCGHDTATLDIEG